MELFYLTDDKVSNVDNIKKIEIVGSNFKNFRKSINNEELEGASDIIETERNNIECKYNNLGSRPVSYSVLFKKIKRYFGWKQSKSLCKKVDYFEYNVSKQLKMISVIQKVFLIASETMIEIKDNETINHMQRTQRYVKELAEYLSQSNKYSKILTKETIDIIVSSALIHDIGKIGIPQTILMKKEKLSTKEFNLIKTHTTLGMEAIEWIVKFIGERETFLKHAKEMAYYHHERWDGNGYPNGVKNYDIPISARILAVADVYDALTSERVYKEIIKHDAAVEIIIENSGKHFDPDVVCAFIELQNKFKEISNIMK